MLNGVRHDNLFLFGITFNELFTEKRKYHRPFSQVVRPFPTWPRS